MLKVLIFFALCADIYQLSATSGWRKLMKNVGKGIDLSEDSIKGDAGKKVADVVRELMKSQLDTDIHSNNSVCSCKKNTCGCCIHLEWDIVNLNDTVCANFTYLPTSYGISLTFSLDGKIIYNNTISARDPPAVCVDIPYLKKLASLCIKFRNLDIKNKTLSGCVYVLAELAGVKLEDVKIGCFKIPPGQTEDVTMDMLKMVNNGLHVNNDDELNEMNTMLEDTDMVLRFKPRN